MTFLWTLDHRLGGKEDLITFFLEEPVSHFGIRFNNGMVAHWGITGFKYETEFEFLENRTVKYEMHYEISDYREELAAQNIVEKHKDSNYDFIYLIWLIWRAFLLTFFGIKIPYGEPNGETTNSMICHEALEAFPEDIRPKYNSDKANTPYRLYLELKKGSSNAIS